MGTERRAMKGEPHHACPSRNNGSDGSAAAGDRGQDSVRADEQRSDQHEEQQSTGEAVQIAAHDERATSNDDPDDGERIGDRTRRRLADIRQVAFVRKAAAAFGRPSGMRPHEQNEEGESQKGKGSALSRNLIPV